MSLLTDRLTACLPALLTDWSTGDVMVMVMVMVMCVGQYGRAREVWMRGFADPRAQSHVGLVSKWQAATACVCNSVTSVISSQLISASHNTALHHMTITGARV